MRSFRPRRKDVAEVLHSRIYHRLKRWLQAPSAAPCDGYVVRHTTQASIASRAALRQLWIRT